MAFDEKKYKADFEKQHYYKVTVMFPLKDKDRIKDAALLHGLSVSAFVKKIILFELDSEDARR